MTDTLKRGYFVLRCMLRFSEQRELVFKLVHHSINSAGSRFWQGGTFEVTKKDDEPIDLTESPTASQPKSALKVTVPSELEGVAYIQVIIKRQSGRYVWLYYEYERIYISLLVF